MCNHNLCINRPTATERTFLSYTCMLMVLVGGGTAVVQYYYQLASHKNKYSNLNRQDKEELNHHDATLIACTNTRWCLAIYDINAIQFPPPGFKHERRRQDRKGAPTFPSPVKETCSQRPVSKTPEQQVNTHSQIHNHELLSSGITQIPPRTMQSTYYFPSRSKRAEQQNPLVARRSSSPPPRSNRRRAPLRVREARNPAAPPNGAEILPQTPNPTQHDRRREWDPTSDGLQVIINS